MVLIFLRIYFLLVLINSLTDGRLLLTNTSSNSSSILADSQDNFSVYVKTYSYSMYSSSSCSENPFLSKITNGVCSYISNYYGYSLYAIVDCDSQSTTSKFDFKIYQDSDCLDIIYDGGTSSPTDCFLVAYFYNYLNANAYCKASSVSTSGIIGTIVSIVIIVGFCSTCGVVVRRYCFSGQSSSTVIPMQALPQTQAHYAPAAQQPQYTTATYAQVQVQPVVTAVPLVSNVSHVSVAPAVPGVPVAFPQSNNNNYQQLPASGPIIAPNQIQISNANNTPINLQLYGGFVPQLREHSNAGNRNGQYTV